MRIGILGAGLIGGYLGGRLLAGGHDVCFAARPHTQRVFAAHGVKVADYAGFSAHVAEVRASDVTVLSECEHVLVAVKSGQSEQAARELAPVLAKGARVWSFQNGVDAAPALQRALGRKVLCAMVPFNVVERGPGHFYQATSGALVLEETDDDALHAAFRRAGLAARTDRDMLSVQWGKLLLNLNNAVNALSGRTLHAELSERGYRTVLADAMAEGLRVTRSAGLSPRIDAPVPIRLVPHVLRLPTPLFRVLAASMLRIDPAARSSMLEDLSQGRVTEIEALQGAIVRLAQEVGTDAPINRALRAAVVRAHESGSPNLSPEALRAQL